MRRLFTLREPPPPLVKRAVGLVGVGLAVLVWFLITLARRRRPGSCRRSYCRARAGVLRNIPTLFTERALVASTAATLRRVITGFGLAIVVGVPLGILAGAYRIFDAFTGPISVFLRNIPVAVLIPLTILWFGIDESQKVMFIFIATAPFVFFDATRAVASVHERYVETAQTLGASPAQVVMKVLIPLAMPDIYNSLRSLFGLCLRLHHARRARERRARAGRSLMSSQRRGLTEHIFAILIVIGLLAYGIDRLLYWFQRGLFPHRTDDD
jgi:NitT/TauT family transport system permease protein